ncbi:tetratricopeptide repeat protein [Paludibaculum fermentans]|uniref:tetratricopeptide repeat protein n=1 Tax=Paludibaculum fermentans TaxID=1473598 RepID=UPI003EBE72D7
MFLLLLSDASCALWPADPATAAYTSLRENRLDAAVSSFHQALPCNPANARIRKDFAYTLLRTGDRFAARRQFEEALRLDPTDESTALESAFLSFETGQPREARRLFLRLKESSDPGIRAKADIAFEGIDEPLRTGIARWQEALRRAPGQWSAHEELARLAEKRDELALAAEHFEEAWRRRPGNSDLLLDLARIWTEQGETAKARAALVSAWRTGTPRVAESAREQMRGATPAAGELALAVPSSPAQQDDAPGFEAKEMGTRSLENSYLNDALTYLTQAYQQNPGDAEVLYQLGVTNNMLHRDAEALQWFGLARRSDSPAVASKAAQAYSALRASRPGLHFSAWFVPLYSSRWDDAFLYSQMTAEYRLGRSIFTPYVSLRFLGDTRSGAKFNAYTYLSETSIIGALGLKARLFPRAYGWFEAGEAVSYLGHRPNQGLASPDYRGGLAWSKGWGRLFGAPESGWFTETALDGVYLHRQQDDMLLYSQTQFGYTLAKDERGHQLMAYWNFNLTADRLGVSWANFAEFGPGFRVHLPGMPHGMVLRYDILYGKHTMPAGFRNPGYWDIRTGLWYAISH